MARSGLCADERSELWYASRVFGLTHGELFIICFVTAVIVTAPSWPKLGEGLARLWPRSNPRPGEGQPSQSSRGAEDE